MALHKDEFRLAWELFFRLNFYSRTQPVLLRGGEQGGTKYRGPHVLGDPAAVWPDKASSQDKDLCFFGDT